MVGADGRQWKGRTVKKHAFSLIELLVVTGIILILVGIAFPVYALVKRKAQIAKTKAQISQMKVALTGYQSTYQILPFTATYSTDALLDSGEYSQLIATLSSGNPRGITFLELETPGTFRDAWGNSYYVALDLDYSGSLDPAKVYGSGGLDLPYAIWSMGPDGEHDKDTVDHASNEDNITSWGGSD